MVKKPKDLSQALFDLFLVKGDLVEPEITLSIDAEAQESGSRHAEPSDPMPAVLLDPGAIAIRYSCASCGAHTYAVEIVTAGGVTWLEVHSERSTNLPMGKKLSGVNAPAMAATRGYVAGLECQACGTLLVRCLARESAHHAAVAGEIQFQ